MKSTKYKSYTLKFKGMVIGFFTVFADGIKTPKNAVDTFTVNASDDLQDFLNGEVSEFELPPTSKSLYLAKGEEFIGYFNGNKYTVNPEVLSKIWKDLEFQIVEPKS